MRCSYKWAFSVCNVITECWGFFLLISLEICKACCCASCCNGDCLQIAYRTTSVLESFSRTSDADVSLAVKCRVPGRTLACKHPSTKDCIWTLQSRRSSWVFWGFSFPSHLLGTWPFVCADGHKACLVREEFKYNIHFNCSALLLWFRCLCLAFLVIVPANWCVLKALTSSDTPSAFGECFKYVNCSMSRFVWMLSRKGQFVVLMTPANGTTYMSRRSCVLNHDYPEGEVHLGVALF